MLPPFVLATNPRLFMFPNMQSTPCHRLISEALKTVRQRIDTIFLSQTKYKTLGVPGGRKNSELPDNQPPGIIFHPALAQPA